MKSRDVRMPVIILILTVLVAVAKSTTDFDYDDSNSIHSTLQTPHSLPSLKHITSTFSLRNITDQIIPPDFNPVIKSIINQLVAQLDKLIINELNSLDYLDDDELQEKLFFVTSSTTAVQYISFYGLVYTALWALVVGIVVSMIVCYWVGCEYDDETSSSEEMMGYSGRSLGRSLAKYVVTLLYTLVLLFATFLIENTYTRFF